MGIFGALTTAVTGLQAQSFALENISGNIANSQTVAYKRTDTSFADLVLGGELGIRRQASGSVQAFSRQTNDVNVGLQTSSSGTSIGVNGAGYFIVSEGLGEAGGRQSFGGDLYTRRGDFEFDKNGYLVNGAGYYLKGIAVDPVTGARTGSASTPIQFANDGYPATATSEITYRANLPKVPQTKGYDAADPSSWLLGAGLGDTILAEQSSAFTDSSIAGDSLTVYDAAGGAHDVQLRWAKVTNADATATPPTGDAWALYYLADSNAADGEAQWVKVDADPSTAGVQNYGFDDKGAMTTPAGGSVAIAGLTLDGTAIGDVTLDHGTGLTQFADEDGAATTRQFTQDGAAAGSPQSVEIADGGKVNVTYSNGKTRTLFEVPVVTFQAENRLAQVNGGAYAQTVASGGPLDDGGAGSIVGSALEMSNVDVADEFTKMIVTQQAYSANTRVISTSNDMLQETLSMIR